MTLSMNSAAMEEDAPMSPPSSIGDVDDLLDSMLGPSSPEPSHEMPVSVAEPEPVKEIQTAVMSERTEPEETRELIAPPALRVISSTTPTAATPRFSSPPIPPKIKRMVTPMTQSTAMTTPASSSSAKPPPAYARMNRATTLKTQYQQEKRAKIKSQTAVTPPRRTNRNLHATSYSPKNAFHSMSPKATAQRNKDSRLPSVRSSSSTSVFDRLYKTQTVSSRAWAAHQNRNPVKQRVNIKVDDEASKIFNRLYISGTASNSSKRLCNRPALTTKPLESSFSPSSNASVAAGSVMNAPTRTATGRLVYSPHMTPKTKLLFCSRYHPSVGAEEMPPISLGYHFFQQFCEYETGNLSARELSCDIIIALFKKDFPPGRDWQAEDPTVFEVRGSKKKAYKVQMRAVVNGEGAKGKPEIAVGKGMIRFLPDEDEIRVEDYLYSVNKSKQHR